MTSLNIPSGKESEDLPYLYWIPKLHKTPYKERYIAGSSTDLGRLLKSNYINIVYSRYATAIAVDDKLFLHITISKYNTLDKYY
jgi:hypothetical protein